MKRALSIVLSVILSLSFMFSIPVFSAEIEFESKSIQELVELKNAIEEELSKRLGTEDMIGEGVYTVGKDIKQGNYVFTAVNTDLYVKIKLFESKEDYDAKNPINNDGNTGYLEPNSTMSLSLHDGMVLQIYDGDGVIKAVKPSWAVE